MTADARVLHLSISNDGSDDAAGGPLATSGRTGNGLRNLAARLEAAGGRQAATREDGTFSLAVELPVV
jgi:signal transduction histidine kinase